MLREKIPDFDLAVEAYEEVVVPRARQPVSVSFRPGASLGEVVAAVGSHKNVLLEAAPGTGKSTRVPLELAHKLNKLVLHVLPNERLASQLANYLGESVDFVVDVDAPLPRQGVVLMSAPCLVARWLAAGKPVLPECVLFHDESHESDAYTYVVKLIAPTLDMVSCYVSATATAAAEGFRTLELSGRLEKGTYEGAATSWDPYDVGKPWSMTEMRDNAVLFTDSRSLTARLQDEFSSAGFKVLRLHSRMTLEQFEHVDRQLADVNGPLTVVIADSSHRSGFTFPVGVIVDSGKIGYLETSTGRPIRREREVYALEAFQTAARGARVAGLATKYVLPATVKPKGLICDLEAVEAEAAALILRFLGYKPTREFSECAMYSGKVPRDLQFALQGDQPLALMRADNLVEMSVLSKPSGRRSPFLADKVVETNDGLDVRNVRVSADSARAAGQAGVSRSTDWDVDWQSGLAELLIDPDTVEELELGRAYFASGLETEVNSATIFPDGADSVLRYMQRNGTTKSYLSLSSWLRSIAVNLLMPRQAALAAELDGIRRVVQHVKSSGTVRSPATKQLAVQMVERLSGVSAEANQVNAALTQLGRGFCSFHEMDINLALSDSIYQTWLSAWDTVPVVSNQRQLESGHAVAREGARAFGSVWSGSKARIADKPYVPMLTYGGGMRAARVTDVPSLVSSATSSSIGDERCVGSTYWERTLRKTPRGELEYVKTLCCERCGRGAKKRMHGY